ncbi:MAG TPA: hypothetical protein VEX89_03290 [Actinomycetes bacterium]|nr:hypothetical protein [Actinomycetes bacterium]
MTDSPGHGRHPDLDALADLHADAPEATETARAHVAGCAQCATELARLDRVPALLAAAGAVGPMPVEVVTAVDAALAAEAGAADAAPGSLTAGRTVTPMPTGRDRSPVTMRLLQAAAVVVLLLAGLGIGISALGGGGDSDSSTAGGADSATADKAAESGAYPLTASGRDWTADAVTLDALKLLDGSLAPPVAANSLREQFSAQAEDDAGSGGSTDPSASAPARAAPESAARLASGPALAQCVAELAGRPVTPLAVDISTWQQQPAAVIVLPAPGEPSRAEVWVVAPSCSTADAKLLYYANLPR